MNILDSAAKTIVLVQPRTAVEGGQQLKFIAQTLDMRQVDIARAYQVDRQDVNKMVHGLKRIPERCVPVHMLLLELAQKSILVKEVA